MRNWKILFPFLFKEKGIVSKKTIARFIGDKPVILEAGAHIGTDTCEMASLWPNSKIYAFEPIPELFNQLKNNTSQFENVKCFQMALGDKTGTCTIFQSSGDSDASSSILEPKNHLIVHPDVKFEKKIEVPVITLKDWMDNQGIEKIDFLWLDLQGFEFNVLKASKEVLENVSVIYSEVSLIENYTNSTLYPEFKNWLQYLGFKVQREELAWDDAGNVLFIKK